MSMIRNWFPISLILLACGLIAVAVSGPRFPPGFSPRNVLQVPFMLYGWHQTRHSEGYTNGAFRRVHLEMSEDDVLDLLGEPLERSEWTERGEVFRLWKYSERTPGNDGDFFRHWIRFRNDGVSQVIAEFWWD